MKKIFIIEHLEPELFKWCLIEYKHISRIVGKKNLWFTNVGKEDKQKLEKFGKVFEESTKSIKIDNVCILDAESDVLLTTDNSRDIEYFVFGGILGDYPPRKRTKEELSKFFPKVKKFNIGKEQMSTDNAVYTVKKILDGGKFENMKFQDLYEIEINDILTTELPYRYNVVNGKPLISEELVKYIKERDKIED